MPKVVEHDEEWWWKLYVKNYGTKPTAAHLEEFKRHYKVKITTTDLKKIRKHMAEQKEMSVEERDYRDRVEKYIKRCQESGEELNIGLSAQLEFDKVKGITAVLAFPDLKSLQDKKTVEDVIHPTADGNSEAEKAS